MKHGDKIRLRGPAGAPFVATVGRPFSADYINAQLDSGDWVRLDGAEPPAATPTRSPVAVAGPASALKPAADKPPVNAPKADWIEYVVRHRLLGPEDAKAYTKADLIDLTH